MSEHVNPTLPLEAKCPACGRRWTQTYLWPEGEPLTCACGAFAEQVVEDAGPPTVPSADRDPA